MQERIERAIDGAVEAAVPDSDTFDAKSAAEERAAEIGCTGAHEMPSGKWMPCGSHDEYHDATGQSDGVYREVEAHAGGSHGAVVNGYRVSEAGDGGVLVESMDEVPQASDDGLEVTFESDEKRGLMKVWELGEHRAELRFLRAPDTDEPFNSPWHVKVIGPDPLAGGRVTSIWSGSYSERETAESKALDRLRSKHRRLQDRP